MVVRHSPQQSAMSPRLALLACGLLLTCGARGQAAVNEGDVKYLTCVVCREAAMTMSRMVGEVQQMGYPLSEENLVELAAAVCDLNSEAGQWIRSADYFLSSDSRSFKIKINEQRGKCGAECLTVQRACSAVIEPVISEIAEALYAGDSADIVKEMCDEITSACSSRKAIKTPEGRGSEIFTPLSDEELQAEYEAMAQYEYGDEGEEEGPPHDQEEEWMNHFADSPLARLETWAYDLYTNSSSWVRSKLGAAAKAEL
ncbi:hypothetical protein T492DRAFT_1034585 [Pavlovales sp. CCMP2436]|nr:hypothetical protein T492DRAFT_1034585 [Pavlovales sp. CCMP2436]